MKKILHITFLLFIITVNSQTMRLDSIVGENIYILYNYDANNINIGAEVFQKNSDNTWNKVSKSTLIYNSDNLVQSEIYTELDGNTLTNDTKEEYTYNSDLSIDRKTNYAWVSNQWQIDYIKDFQYSSGGVINEILMSTDGTSSSYDMKEIYTYNNNVLTKTEQYFRDDNEWESNPWEKTEYSYYTDGNLKSKTDYEDSDRDGVWTIGPDKIEFTYDNNYTTDNLILPFMYYLEFEIIATPSTNHNKVTNFEIFDVSNSEWSSNGIYTYFYTDTTLSTNELNNINCKVYPNPTKDQVKFEINDFEKITIYDISGKLILKTKSNIVNMKNIQSGVYLYKIHKDNKIINGKIIKK